MWITNSQKSSQKIWIWRTCSHIFAKQNKFKTMDAKTIARLKKSVRLSNKEINYLKKTRASHETVTAAAIALKINKDVLDRAIAFGSCSEKTYNILFGGN